MDPQFRQAKVTFRKSFWLPVVGFLLLVALGFAFLLAGRDRQFDSTAWQAQKHLRPHMIRSLLAEHQLVGMTRGEVEGMLGEPDSRNPMRPGDYIYRVGTDGLIDDMWLEVDFWEDRVVATRYVPD